MNRKLVALMLGVVFALALPSLAVPARAVTGGSSSSGTGCVIVNTAGALDSTDASSVLWQKVLNTAKSGGGWKLTCKFNFFGYTGPQLTFNFANPGFVCYFGDGSDSTQGLNTGVGQSTTAWSEQISTSGQTTLQCYFPPGTV